MTMTRKLEMDVTRRFMLAASAGMLLPRWSWADVGYAPVLQWKLADGGDVAVESVSGARDAIASRTHHALWVGEGSNRALRLDGYSVWFRHNSPRGVNYTDEMTIMAWVALEAYPVNEAALVQMDSKAGTVFRFSIDRLGFLQCGPHPGDAKSISRSSQRVAKGKWVHLAASMGSGGCTLYCDGEPWGPTQAHHTKFKPPEDVNFVLGGSPDCVVAAGVFPTGMINGLLRDVRLYDRQLASSSLAEIVDASRPHQAPDLQLNGPWCVNDPQRPLCHAQPPRAWTNEPHGLIHWRGKYHLFYQKNPNGPYWGHLNWGHMTSPDLLRWTELPVALTPESGFDNEGCWSGSVIEHEGRLAILYTGVDGVKAGIALAFSDDGIQFTKHPENPVIPRPPNSRDFLDFRDPFVWREGEVYYLIVGSGVKDVGGAALLYRSNDLTNWEYRKQILSGNTGSSGFFWEMPIFLKDGDRYALVVSELPGRATYWVGSWRDENFTPMSSTPRHLELFNHLLSPTPMIEENGEIVVMGIIPDQRSPAELSAAGWAHLYSLPRLLSIYADGSIVQRPHRSVEALCQVWASFPSIDLESGLVHDLPNIAETSVRLRATFKRGASKSVSLMVRRAPKGEEQTVILYEWEKGLLTLDRSQSSLNRLVKRDRQTTAYLPTQNDLIRLDIFVDRSVMEVFVDDRAAFATRIYPSLNNSAGVAFASEGIGAIVEEVRIARMERPA
jgi:sucrose-6-phosphate hydrolase SacC (GH32 family)